MRLLWALIRQEWKLQWRSTRLRLALPCYLGLGVVPAVLVATLVIPTSEALHGPMTFVAQSLLLLPLLTTLLAMLVAGNCSDHGALEERWCPLASARLSSGGWLLRRWLALLTLLLPVTVIPVLLSGVTAWVTVGELPNLEAMLLLWATRLAPVAILLSGYWLAMVTLVGGELSALVLSVVLLVGGSAVVGQVLFQFRVRWTSPVEMLGIPEAQQWLTWTSLYITKPERRHYHPGFAASESLLDPADAVEQFLGQGTILASVAFLALALGLAHARRTQRDLRPWVVGPKHPLRNFIVVANNLRHRYSADGGRGYDERALQAALAVIGLLFAGLWWDRQRTWQDLASERYEAMTQHAFEPMDPEILPTRWDLQGRLQANGRIEVETTTRWRHAGDQSAPHLTLLLNSGIEIVDYRVEGRATQIERAWDRLQVHLDPPLAPGDTLEAHFSLAGVPIHPTFGLRLPRHHRSFARGFELQKGGRFPRDLHDFAAGRERRAVTRRQVALRPGDLVPLPRYTTLELTPRSDTVGSFGRIVRDELLQPEVDLRVDLEAPDGWFLADACGGLRRRDAEPGVRLRSHCTMAVEEWRVLGGNHRLVDGGSGTSVATLDTHAERGENLLASVEAAASLSDRAWPGLAGLDRLVVIEQLPPVDLGLTGGLSDRWFNPFRARLHGRLVSVPEALVIGGANLQGESLVGLALAKELMRRRPLDREQLHLFQGLFRGLTIRRMGLDRRGAGASGAPWIGGFLERPFLKSTIDSSITLSIGIPAVMVEVESRLGATDFYRLVDAFLDRQDDPPATMLDLFDFLEARSGVSLRRMYDDYFVEGKLPRLELRDVEMVRQRGSWIVRGAVHNAGTGEVQCPVVVKTELGERRTQITVADDGTAPFEVVTENRPVRVVIDPERTCYRLALGQFQVRERVDLVEAP